MAILHIMGVNHTHPDPVKDARGCYKIGDIVTVNDDTAHDGNLVKNPIAPGRYLVRITDRTRAQLERYAASHVDVTDPLRPVILRRRLYRVRVADVPVAIRTILQRDRYVEVTWAQVRAFVRNMVTGVDE